MKEIPSLTLSDVACLLHSHVTVETWAGTVEGTLKHIDFQRKVVNITPEKGSNPRILPISDKLIGMLQRLPKNAKKSVVFNLNKSKNKLLPSKTENSS